MSFKLLQPAIPYNDSCLISNLWEPAIPCNGNLWIPGFSRSAVPCHGNLWFHCWEPSVPTFRNWKIFAMETYGSQVGEHEFQPLGPAVACNGNLWFPSWEPWLLTCGNRQLLAMVTCGSHFGKREFQPLGTGSPLPWTKRKHSGTGPFSKTKRSLPVH